MFRTKPGAPAPQTLDDYFRLVSDVDIYGDSGIARHLYYLSQLAYNNGGPRLRIAELGIGGGDQSTIAWLTGRPAFLMCIDVNVPDTIPILRQLAASNGIDFQFYQKNTAESPVVEVDITFIDTLHDAATVDVELERYAAATTTYLVFHDVVTFARNGQFHPEGTNGIMLAIGDFLMRHPEWQVERFSEIDNGLLTLKRQEGN